MTTPTTAAGRAHEALMGYELFDPESRRFVNTDAFEAMLWEAEAEARAEADAQIAALRVPLADEVAGYRGSTARSRRVLTDTAPAASWADERAAPPEDIRNLPFDGDAAPAEEARDG